MVRILFVAIFCTLLVSTFAIAGPRVITAWQGHALGDTKSCLARAQEVMETNGWKWLNTTSYSQFGEDKDEKDSTAVIRCDLAGYVIVTVASLALSSEDINAELNLLLKGMRK